jgi:UrcA family protein
MKAILSAAWAAVLFISALPAAASIPDYDTRSVTVDYSDLDLSHARGVSTLQDRVSGAVRTVCGGPASGLFEQSDQHRCIKIAASTAAGDVGKAIAAARQQPWMQSSTIARTVGSTGSDKTGSVLKQQPFAKSSGSVSTLGFGKQIDNTIAAPKLDSRTGIEANPQR